VSSAHDAPRYELVAVAPERARELLGGNTHNRNLRGRLVSAYAADMAAGRWVENGETIKISIDGTVIDGQHRLHAVIQSEETVKFLIIFNLPMSSQDTVDTGAKRSFADVLRLREEHNYKDVASVTRRVHLWNLGARRNNAGPVPTIPQLLNTLEENPDIRISADMAAKVHRAIPIHASVAGLCYWLFSRIDADDAAFFWDRVADGANLVPTDPVSVLRRTIIDHMTGQTNLADYMVLAYVIKAWNSYREGRPMHVLKYRPGGAKPEQFPEPK
jgi:hypothetical protein